MNHTNEEKFWIAQKNILGMIQLAVKYNNLGVDILSSKHEESTTPKAARDLTQKTIHRNEKSGQSHCKRRKYANIEANEEKESQRNIDQKVDDALAYFQKALSLIVQTTEYHHYNGNGLKYHPNDNDGFMKYENAEIAKELTGSINSCETEFDLQGENGCSNSFIYCKAIKIGENNPSSNEKTYNNEKQIISSNVIESGSDGVVENICGEDDIDRNLHKHSSSPKTSHEMEQNHPVDPHLQTHCLQESSSRYDCYDSLTTSLFHSMICIYNIALCYQYKGMTTKEEAKRMQAIGDSTRGATPYNNHHTFRYFSEFDRLVASSEYFLKASVDHYTRAYELMTRFRLENGSQYTVLMATMNNLAATYQSLEQSYKADICNRYLMKSLILIICSSERDGHLGQEVLSRSNRQETSRRSGVLATEEDQNTFESFLSNVTHLMMGGDEIYHGEITATAA